MRAMHALNGPSLDAGGVQSARSASPSAVNDEGGLLPALADMAATQHECTVLHGAISTAAETAAVCGEDGAYLPQPSLDLSTWPTAVGSSSGCGGQDAVSTPSAT